MYFSISKSGNSVCNFHASDIDESLKTDLTQPIEKSEKGWANYLLGIYAELQKRGIDFRASFTHYKAQNHSKSIKYNE